MDTIKSLRYRYRKNVHPRMHKTDGLIFISILITFPVTGLFSITLLLNYLSLVTALLLFCFYLVSIIRQKVPAKVYLPLLIYAYLFIDTLIHNGDIIQAGSCMIRDLSCFYLVAYWLLNGKRIELIFNSSRAFDFLLTLNGLHMLLTKDGFGFTRSNNHIFILSSDNSLTFFIIAFVIVHELRNRIRPFGFVRNCLYYAVILYELVRGEAATSYFVFLFLVLGILLSKKVAVNRFFFTGCEVILLLNIFLIFIRKLSFIEPLFKFLGKDITLSGRLRIWDNAIGLVNKHAMVGYGISDNMYYVSYNNVTMEAHNMLLSYMLQGGIILLILMGFLIFLYGWKIKWSKSIASRYVTVGVLAYLINFLVESPAYVYGFYFMMALCLMEERKFGEKRSEIATQNF